jgi:hypothetical protein
MIHAMFKELAKRTFFGGHTFIHIGEVVMFDLLMADVVGVDLNQVSRLGQACKAGFYLTLTGFGLCMVRS